MTSTTRFRLLGTIASVSAFSLLALEACGGGDNNSNDGGQDATTNDVAQNDVVAQDSASDAAQNDGGVCPTYTGSSVFCKAAIAHCNTCGPGNGLNECQVQNINAVCSYFDTLFSSQYESAVSSCATACDSDASTACVRSALADASLSTDQQKLVTDYCARCGATSGCATQASENYNVIQMSDELATKVDTTCVPDAGGPDSSACVSGFGACALGIELQAIEGAPCADAGGD